MPPATRRFRLTWTADATTDYPNTTLQNLTIRFRDAQKAPEAAQALKLTGRERQILTMVSLGMKNKEMASALSISEGTLKVYVSRLLQKTGLRDRHQLALYRLRNPEAPMAPPPRLNGGAHALPVA